MIDVTTFLGQCLPKSGKNFLRQIQSLFPVANSDKAETKQGICFSIVYISKCALKLLLFHWYITYRKALSFRYNISCS